MEPPGASNTLRIERVDPVGAHARYCLERYFEEIDRRFDEGFDESEGIPVAESELVPPRGAFLVAFADDRPVACGGVRQVGPGVAYLKRMWVDASVRGMGLGRRMLAALEAAAAELGLHTVQLETNRALVEAIALYRSSGYVEVPPFNDERYAHHWFEKRLA